MHPILILLSPARSGSTAIMRCLDETSLFTVFHEPFVEPWNTENLGEKTSGWYATRNSYRELEERILKAAEETPVLVKEMVFASADWLEHHSQLRGRKNVYFVFLLRQPYDELVSVVKRYESLGLPNNNFPFVSDYSRMEQLFNACVESKSPTRICSAERLLAHPSELQAVLRWVNLDAKIPTSWTAKSDSFNGSEWSESKYLQDFRHWHSAALNSTGPSELTHYEQDWSQFTLVDWAKQRVNDNLRVYNRLLSKQ